jgi:hypothetical protein
MGSKIGSMVGRIHGGGKQGGEVPGWGGARVGRIQGALKKGKLLGECHSGFVGCWVGRPGWGALV